MIKYRLLKLFILILCVFPLITKFCNGFQDHFTLPSETLTDSNEYENSSLSSSTLPIKDWITQINKEYKLFNQYSAFYVWELSTNNINLNEEFYDEAIKLNCIRNKWRNRRCSESEKYYNEMTYLQKRMVYLLCRGPKYTEYQASQLSSILDDVQNIYTDTKICIPKSFDICINYNRIWDYTYMKLPNDDNYIHLDMSPVKPKNQIDYNPLHFYDGKSNYDENDVHNYYVFRGIKENFQIIDEDLIDGKIKNDISSSSSSLICMNIEPQLENIMSGDFNVFERNDCTLPTDLILHWTWEVWRFSVGHEIGKYYPNAVYFMNLGAQNNGYHNIGECWREELETDNLPLIVRKLWYEFKPHYKKLHAILRNAFRKKYLFHRGKDKFPSNGTLPAHLLGNMWAQDWSAYYKLLNPFPELDLDENFRNTNWTVIDMVKRAEDFFSSLGLDRMTNKFWKYSKFEKTSNLTKCHGSAANMFDDDDFRIIVCAEKRLQDFYVIIHEMGHIQYYMYANKQPPLFQDATNSAFNEAIGDAIFLAMMTPQHLNRLGLLSDENLFTEKLTLQNLIKFHNRLRIIHEMKPNFENLKFYENLQANLNEEDDNFISKKNAANANPKRKFNLFTSAKEQINLNRDQQKRQMLITPFDISLLLRLSLMKLPQIPFEFIIDIFRWDLFNGRIPFEKSNSYFWKLCKNEQGIHPPDSENRNQKYYFDAGSKFHVADNTPYVRYFLASFLQAQIFKGLCEKTLFNRVNTNETLPMPLHRCDIYGSKRAGNLLKHALKRGASTHWTEILFVLTGKKEITIEPLLEYYEPLFKWMDKLIIDFDIEVGW